MPDIVFAASYAFGILMCWGTVVYVLSDDNRFAAYWERYETIWLILFGGFGVFPIINTIIAIIIVFVWVRNRNV